ncbi:NUC185 domain-domain-containing protein [Clohesyomyces aquaticus]|uniref:NUC185 domain-domain-containing protein n=1 Tax=Clohesyomyces aquaticus TaxID=1231657 RepID=A0A1Y1YY32_9PLEO|nr:NUC185 domain-domain-containing protein [Clohesyomyces aquaticus]
MNELQAALEKAHLIGTEAETTDTAWADSILSEQRPRKKIRKSTEAVKQDLERDFLTPSPTFNTQWLNQLQQRWDAPTEYRGLFDIAPTQTRTIIRFTREGLEGRVTGYKEVTVPASSATAKNSTSLLRKPANRAEFVRGASGFFPFAPGGLDGVEAIAAIEDEAILRQETANARKSGGLDRVINFGAETGLLEIAPGFTRGLDFSKNPLIDSKAAADVEYTLGAEPSPAQNGAGLESQDTDDKMNGLTKDDKDCPAQGDDEIDLLLPVEFPALAPHGALALASTRKGGKEWAHMVDVNREITNFHELVPEMARQWPFELDTFQKEAVYHLENGDSVFVAAHTSAGKTVVAEYAIALAAKHMTKAIYTSPIKALSNQKFRDFRLTFDDVGILTGDVQIRPEASCLIMTTEILRSMLYRGADLIRDVEFVIFDEVHYVNDLERGVVWEEVIIMLPEHVTLILLSATVPNTYEFASWVGRTKKKDIYVISTPKRPVPLEHYLWADKTMHKIVTADKKFLENGWKDASDALSGKDKVKASPLKEDTSGGRGGNRGRGGAAGGGRGRGQQGSQRGGLQRGGGPQAQRARGNIARTGRGGGRTTAAQDRNIWVHLVQHLRNKELLPACIFVFSKKRCEENADALSNLDFCTAAEKSAIHMTIEKSIARLSPEDRDLPQIRRLRELLSRGIAVHHGGMLPIVKEVVEILFAKTLVKVLFATETFAMGLNLPTRTVVFSGFRKHDGRSFRDLLPGEYTQMAGRAGRRGLDPVGSVIIVTPGADEAPQVSRLRQMILGEPTKLRSQFRLTYNMMLNLLRVEALKIEEMIKRSFSENATQALLPEHEKKVKLSESDLEKVKREPCAVCDIDLELCHQACMDYQRRTNELHLGLLTNPVGRRVLGPKRLVVYKKNGIRTIGMLLQEGTSKGNEPTVKVFEICQNNERKADDLLPFLPPFARYYRCLPKNENDWILKTGYIPLNDIECLTRTVIDIPEHVQNLNKRKEALDLARDQFVPLTKSSEATPWNYKDWHEYDWGKIKNLAFRELDNARRKDGEVATHRECLNCPDFLKHLEQEHDEWIIRENILQLRQLMSDQNLQLLPDYEQRISVLKDLGFIDEGSRVELKGKVACEIHSADELVLTELILENVLAEYEPDEIVALLSAFVFQEKTGVEPSLTASLERGMAKIVEISEKVNQLQTLHQVILSSDDSNDFVSKPRFGMVEVVYEWARGMSFNRITDLTDVMEGTIVRVMTRLDETCREVKNAARIIGDPTLFQKMGTCQELIKRDICNCASLYL